ncbi:MAG: molybdopterin-dependent oxidoreductase [Pyrinomonadaceae bacterium]|nr:molybdopterin-dependent oxidoreductase [Pyrinomonadaceae bacterium]
MINIDAKSHVRGESVYLDDIPLLEGTLFACVYDSQVAHGKLKSVDISEAKQCAGVVKIILAKDLKGENQIGGILPDEPLLADEEVHFCGMPIAIVVAETDEQARHAVKKIKAEIETLEIITDERIAFEKGSLIAPPKKFVMGDTEKAFKDCEHIFEGQTYSNGQEHLYIETQGAYTIPSEQGGIKVYSSTQGPTAVQKAISKVTGLPWHQIEVDVTRLGGGFGGKEDQANAWACICAVATQLTKKPVKYSLHRMEDMRMTGKRHPYSADYKIGLDKDLKIIAYEAVFYQNAGASCDLSLPVLERTLFHCTNSYFIPNVMATAYSCKTHLPPNTAFRGFGGPQGMFVIESAIAHAAEKLGVDKAEIQQKNLLQNDDEFPYGQKVVSEAEQSWHQADHKFDFNRLKSEAEEFNSSSKYFKKGVSLMPICFGISFTNTRMNQARSLVHVYLDGSVAVSTGAVEMGQGVNTKILQVAADIFSLSQERVKVHTTNTLRIANTSPTAASAGADLNGHATRIACEKILERIKKVASEVLEVNSEEISLRDGMVFIGNSPTEMTWVKLLEKCYEKRISLSEHGHYAPPGINFDWSTAKGHPFAYHVFGTAIIGVTVDCLRGTYEIDYVKACHDFGKTMNTAVDLGQIEGGIVQGIGWMTMEEVFYDGQGRLRSNALSTYKIPDVYSVPKEIDILPLETSRENLAIMNSKAVGEPPLMYGIGAYFAIREAVKAFNQNNFLQFDAPFTAEKVLMNLYKNQSN